MTYFLIVVALASQAVAVDHIPFPSREVCESVKSLLLSHDELQPTDHWKEDHTAVLECVPTGYTQK